MSLLQDVEIVMDRGDQYCEQIEAWHVKLWARVTPDGFLEACMFHEGQKSILFLCIYGNAGSRANEDLIGYYTEEHTHIPLVMLKAIARLRIAFERRCLTVLHQKARQESRQRAIDSIIASMSVEHFTDALTKEIRPASDFIREAYRAGLSVEEFLVRTLYLPDGSNNKPKILGFWRYFDKQFTLVKGSGHFFLVMKIEKPNGTMMYSVIEVGKSVVDILKGDRKK